MRDIEDIYPLSPMQEGMLFHSLYSPETGTYLEQVSVVLQGRLNIQAFESAWREVVRRHSILRTSFLWDEIEQPLQIVHKQVNLPLLVQDWRSIPSEEQKSKLENFIVEQRELGFDLTFPPLMRLALIRISDITYQFIWTHHHLLLDGWSLPILLKEVFSFYEANNLGRDMYLEPGRPFRDYIAWLQKQNMADAEVFWRQKLMGLVSPTPLIVDSPTPLDYENGEKQQAGDLKDYAVLESRLSSQTTQSLKALAQQHQLTINTLVLGAWALLLSRYSSEEDVVFGATVSGRPPDLPGVETMMGLFINTLPVRVFVPGKAMLLPWLMELQSQQASLRQYEYTPLVKIQEWSEVPRGTPLFESILVFENYPVDASLKEQRESSLKITDVQHFAKTNYPLTVIVAPSNELSIHLGYEKSRFERATIERMLGHLLTLIEGFTKNANVSLAELPILTEAERRQLVIEWNETERDLGPALTIHRLIEAQVRQSPDNIALIFGDQTISYGDLNQRANQLAGALGKKGIGPDSLVGILMERSVEMMVGILGILKAGGAYVPMDVNYPPERLDFMLNDSRVALLVTKSQYNPILKPGGPEVICLDTDWEGIALENKADFDSLATLNNLCYVIYTSGSTGRPKGVLITHESLANHAQAFADIFKLVPGDRIQQFISLSFDASAEEIFPALIRGATVVLPDPAVETSGGAILQFCEQKEITVLHLPAAFWHQCVDELATGQYPVPSSLKLVLIGGETPDPERLKDWNRLVKRPVRFLNAYGPTEATISSTFFETTDVGEANPGFSILPIGKPIPNVQTYILDKSMQPTPVGVPGELYLGGKGLARGYLNQPELTLEKFVPNPFISDIGGRLYATGDLARYLPDGNIQFLGRMDYQVKVRGFRVELGEIETALKGYPGIQDCLVLMREDVLGDKRLVAYIIPDAAAALENSETEGSYLQELQSRDLRAHLKQELPDYMAPSFFVTMKAWPLTPSGKIDRRAFPAPDSTGQEHGKTYRGPRSPIEEMVASIWEEILQVDRISMDDNFFELGGHSLLATRINSRLKQAFQIDLPLRSIFENPTAAGVAQQIVILQSTQTGLSVPPLAPEKREGELPLSYSQQRLWFLDQLEPGNLFYNIPTAVRIKGELIVDALQHSLNEIIRRHEALRTTFTASAGKPIQFVNKELLIDFPVIDLSNLPESEREPEAYRLATLEVKKPFDLTKGPMLRAVVFRLTSIDHIVVLVLHHIVSDGWSMGILVNEMAMLYQAFSNQHPSPLPELPIQYADYAIWQRNWLQGEALERQLSYWKQQLSGAPPLLDLPTDRPRPALMTSNADNRVVKIPESLVTGLEKLCREEGVTLFMAFLAAFQVLLFRYSGQEDIVVGSAIANRTRPEIEGLIGFFVNTLVLRTDLSGEPSFRELLGKVREMTLGAFSHQDLPFEMLVDLLQPQRNLSYTPLFQVGFDMQTASIRSIDLPGLNLSPVSVHSGTNAFDLLFSITHTAHGTLGSMDFNIDLFDGATIDHMLDHFLKILESILEDPDLTVSKLNMLTRFELEQLLFDWNDTADQTPTDKCVHQLFEQYAEKQPDAPALLFEDQQLTYLELNRKANQLARYLQKMGVGPETLVGISTDRSPEMIVGILGILKAGGAYLPLDPNYPIDRIAFMIDDSQVPVLVTQELLKKSLPPYGGKTVCLDVDWSKISVESVENVASAVTTENLAYVIYTSGSTGKPKGAMLRHNGLCNLTVAQQKVFAVKEGSRVLQFSPFSFDASVWETFMALANGAALCLARQEVLSSSIDLHRLLQEKEVTNVTLPPSMMRILTNENLPSLRTVIAAGEVCTPDLVARWAPGRDFFNAYGPTETTVCASMNLCDLENPNPPPIGRPIANTQVYVLDKHLQPVPIGVPGELYVGGVGVARGYLRRPELTAEKFVSDPFNKLPGKRLYKTGDLVRYQKDGKIEFLGRIDTQVKVRGFRIELGEIEAALGVHPGVKEAIVLARDDIPGGRRLVAYFVPKEGQSPSAGELRAFLRKGLPEYMIPFAFVIMEKFPLSPSGKVDKKNLPAPEGERRELDREYIAPRNEVEEKLVEISQNLLNIEKVGVYDNFFELGGHSLLATQFISRVRDQFDVELPLRALFEHPNVAELAETLEQARPDPGQPKVPTIAPISRETRRMKRSDLT